MSSEGIARASATLARGADFLAAGLRAGAPLPIAAAGRDKVIGNSLRELDRFLSVLIDEVAAALAPPGLDLAAFSRQRNTANKLRTIREAMALASPDDQRLRAIGRARDGLFHCAETVRHGDRRTARQTAALPDRRAHAARLTPDPDQLRDYCRLYGRIAAELVAACAEHLPGR